MRAAVTGGLGYVGGSICCSFKRAGWEVLSIDNLSTSSVSDSRILGYENVSCGMENPRVAEVLADWKPDVILHCAASSMIEEGERCKKEYFLNNVVNHGRFLASVLDAGATRLIYSGTAGVYDAPDGPTNEHSQLAPATWYSRTKMLAEDMVSSLANAGLLSVAIFRYFSVAGVAWGVYEQRPYDEHVITRLIKCAITGDKFMLNGSDHPTKDGSPVRDFVSAKDIARAHVRAAERMIQGNLPTSVVINLGTGTGTTILELVQAVEAVTGRKITVETGPRRPREPSIMLCDYAKAKRLLDWSPEHELKEELRELWELRMGG